ncbi:hypothetical protein BW14_06050 [Bifidobacterium sp. UTBIF-68]|uniref:helix-turn-helix transcriptional regulator n=1 Tax=Bifidobacterium sp. UTBIF-68 TaxID=1465262 RepID=UPI0011262156|nr:helix-turn-helix transcriptional regulator [Bifidobacterium sp. UTBIF-68]TPF93236.1 hypothetical protein BW14_06050 [Bifidobacterium sp. UTBIF-68]
MSGKAETKPADGRTLRAIRQERSILEQTLARITGIDPDTITGIEDGSLPTDALTGQQAREWGKAIGVNPERIRTAYDATGEKPTPMRRLRESHGWTGPELAMHAGIPYRSLRQYDAGTRDANNMTAGMLAAIAAALHASMEQVAGRCEQPAPAPKPPAGWTGTRLAWHRRRQGLSQAGLSRASGQSIQNIGGIETRRWAAANKRSRIILDLAAALHIPAIELLDPETTHDPTRDPCGEP